MSIVKFGDVVKEVKTCVDRSNNPYEYYVAGDHMDSEDLKIRRRGLFATDDVGPAFIRLFKPGQILYGSRRTYLKKVAVADFEGICSNTTFVVETKDNDLLRQRLLPFIMLSDSFTKWSVSKSKGSTNPYILFSDLCDYEFDLPSIERQDELVNLLWQAYSVKESYREMIWASDEMVKSQFIEMLVHSDQKNKLGDFVKRCTPKRCGDRDLPVLSVTKDKSIVLQDERFDTTVVSRDKSNYIVVPYGFIVQGIHIDEGNFGLQTIVKEGIVSPAYKIWQITNDQIIPELLEYYLRSPLAIEYYKKAFLGTTVMRRQVIHTEDLLAMPTDFPSMPKQKQFWGIKEQSDKSKFELQRGVEAINALMRAIMP